MNSVIQQEEKLSTRVARELEDGILNQRYVAEQPLPSEAKLCQSFGVSRTVIREAIQQLKSVGIIHSIPGSGNYISKSDTSDLKRNISLLIKLNEDNSLYDEILQLRDLLELDCLEKACRAGDPSTVKKLKARLKDMKASQLDWEAFGKADHAFHLEIIKASGNGLYISIFEALHDNFVKANQRVYAQPKALPRLLKEHKEIVEAIENKAEKLACDLLRKHIQQNPS